MFALVGEVLGACQRERVGGWAHESRKWEVGGGRRDDGMESGMGGRIDQGEKVGGGEESGEL